MKCANCRFWVPEFTVPGEATPTFGGCHRYAPRPLIDLVLASADRAAGGGGTGEERPDVSDWSSRTVGWPVTSQETFCGEFQARGDDKPFEWSVA